MNELRVFQNSEFGELGVLEIEGMPYFPATKCAKVLGHENPQRAIREHCKGVTEMVTPTNGGEQMMRYIPEGDLYRLIVSSHLPAAERFERWVFEDVLPTIRKTGGYGDMRTIIAQVAQETAKAILTEMIPLLLGEPEPKRRIRHRSGGIWALDTEVRQDIEDLILSHRYTYTEITELVFTRYGIKTSKSSIGRYASLVYDRVERCQ